MEIKRTLVLDSSDSISKALPELEETPAVVITKNGKYYGIIDHRSLGNNMRLPQTTKCESAVTRPPVLSEGADMMERVNAFLLGHFKALPVLDAEETPIGITTRVELVKELIVESLIPKMEVDVLMGSPVHTIEESQTIGAAKRTLKEKKVHRLVVTRSGILVGVVSTYDIGAWSAKPNLLGSGRKDRKLGEQISLDSMPISSFLRPDLTLVNEGSSVEEAARRMVSKQVSTVIVVSGKKPVGVLSSMDIFRKVQEMAEEGPSIQVSGLHGENARYRDRIVEKMGHVLERFGKTFNIRNASVHVKEGKTTFVVNVYFDIDRGHVSVREERKGLKETIDEVASEVNNVLRKKKETRKTKPRVTHAR